MGVKLMKTFQLLRDEELSIVAGGTLGAYVQTPKGKIIDIPDNLPRSAIDNSPVLFFDNKTPPPTTGGGGGGGVVMP